MKGEWASITTPFNEKSVKILEAGDRILLSGIVYTARDRAHERLCRMIRNKEELPFDPAGQVLYYTGPSPAPPGKIIGSVGPTTSSRMDPFTEDLLKAGLRGMIGKGKRARPVRELFPYYQAVYFSTVGGAGAYLSKKIVSAEIIAFHDLGAEAVYRLEFRDFPLLVINDTYGGDLYEDALHQRK